jgi:hypothetical protein
MKQFVLALILFPCAQGFLVHGPPKRVTMTRGTRMTKGDDSKAVPELTDHARFDDLITTVAANEIGFYGKPAAVKSKFVVTSEKELRDMLAPDSDLNAKFASLAAAAARLESSVDNFNTEMNDKMGAHRVSLANEINGISTAAFWSPVLAFVSFGLATVCTSPDPKSVAEHAIMQGMGEFESGSAWLLVAITGLLS